MLFYTLTSFSNITLFLAQDMVNKISESVKVCNKNEKWDIQADILVGVKKKKKSFETKALKFSHDYVIEKDASLAQNIGIIRKSHKMPTVVSYR